MANSTFTSCRRLIERRGTATKLGEKGVCGPGLAAIGVVSGYVPYTVHHNDDPGVAGAVMRYRDVSDWGDGSKPADIDGVTPLRERFARNEIVNVVPGYSYVVYGPMTPGIPIPRTDAEWRTPEVIVPYNNVVHRMISDGELHTIAAVAPAHYVACVEYIIDRGINRVSGQPVVAIGANALVHVILDDLARV